MHIAVIGTGIVGTCSAAWLQRDGHTVTFIDPREPGEACSFGNAGSLSPSACLPVGMPGMWKKAPGWLLDPLGPLTIRWWYLPVVMPWLARFVGHSQPAEVVRIATAMRALLAPIFEAYGPLLEHAGAQDLVRRSGCLYVYSSRETANQWKWGMDLRRKLGVDLRDVIIGHCGDTDDLDYLMKLADEGSILGMDRFGINVILSLEQRVGTIVELIKRGYIEHITLSHDCSSWMDMFPDGKTPMPDHSYLHISQQVIPALFEAGLSQAQVDQMFVRNPRRHFEDSHKRVHGDQDQRGPKRHGMDMPDRASIMQRERAE